MDQERVGSTFLPTQQDGTTISAFAFDRRIRHFEHWRRRGHPFKERCRNDLEGLLSKDRHLLTLQRVANSQNKLVPEIANFRNL
jgi:hypothetical protein